MPVDVEEYRGFIDGIIGDHMTGWCWQKGSDRPISLVMLVNDVIVATVTADLEREDLARAGIGSGRHGFMSPPVLRGVAPDAVIRMKVVGTDGERSQAAARGCRSTRCSDRRTRVQVRTALVIFR